VRFTTLDISTSELLNRYRNVKFLDTTPFSISNLFCGEHNAHGPLEWVAVQDMESAVTACIHLAELWERKSKLASRVE
jgi:hypothetical protein